MPAPRIVMDPILPPRPPEASTYSYVHRGHNVVEAPALGADGQPLPNRVWMRCLSCGYPSALCYEDGGRY